MDLICVTMETQGQQVYVDAATLFDFGFENFKKADIAEHTSGSVTASVHARTNGVESGVAPTEEIPVQLEEDGYVVLPASVSWEELEPVLYYDTENAKEGGSATLEYSYAGRLIGQAEIALPASLVIPEETPAPVETEAVEETVREEKNGFPWLYLAAGIAAAAALAGGGYLFVRRQIWKARWRRRRSGRRDPVYRQHVRRNNVYHVQARKRSWWRR